MSALDLDALEALCDGATPGPWKVVDAHTVMDPAGFCVAGTEWESDGAFIAAARDAVPALITRLRAAEARTAWQPIETAPKMEWVLARRENLHIPPVVVRRRDRKSPVTLLMDAAFYDDNGSRIRGLTHWSPIPTDATLPDAPEAP